MILPVPSFDGLGPTVAMSNLDLNFNALAAATTTLQTSVASLSPLLGTWQAYTPAIGTTSGTLTSASATGRFLVVGKTCFVVAAGTIVTNGTGAASVFINLPVNAATTQILCGREVAVAGKMLQAQTNTTNVLIFNYDNTYPGFDGANLVVSGVYITV